MANKVKKVLITGISGMVGSHLADFLISNTDWEIHGLIRWRSPLENLENLKFLEIDREKLTDPSLLKIKARNPKIDIRGVD